MTKMLASVNSIEEALLVLAEKVDIIDLKQPASGALGALPLTRVQAIINTIAGRCPISATVGDLPLYPELIVAAVQAMAATGVDYIKIGFFPEGDTLGTINKLAELTAQFKLIAVLFADTTLDLTLLTQLKQAGFVGVMLDTMNKQQGSLTQLLNKTELAHFVQHAKSHALFCGLAGSLRLNDIKALLHYQADYLGFRGALCAAHDRTGQLNTQAIAAIRQALLAS